MKKLFFIMTALALLAISANAQDSNTQNTDGTETETLFGGDEFQSSGYGAFQIKLTDFNEGLGVLVGGRGAWTINKSFSIGGGGYGLVNFPELDYNLTSLDGSITAFDGADSMVTNNLAFGYGGLFFEYIYQPNSVVHISANTLLGFGGASLHENLFNGRDDDEDDEDWNFKDDGAYSAYFVIEPSLAVELNVTKFFRIGLEGSYRIVNEIYTNDKWDNIEELKDLKFNGFAGTLTFQFGLF